jgi:hypothetical protein
VALTIALASTFATASVHVDPRVEAEVARGRVRVLVELRIAGGARPEGELGGADRIAAQRQAIAAAQAAVLSRLHGTDAALVRRFAITPALALEIGPSALAHLVTMGDIVTRIVLEGTASPSHGSN